MSRYRITWTETMEATVDADSPEQARELWMNGIDGEPTDNRHDYDLEIEPADQTA